MPGERWASVSVSVITTGTPAVWGACLGQGKRSVIAVTLFCDANTRTGPAGGVPMQE